jgi:2-amino-4-hydroxy-6-hydroxymethyldihydropteridine diphosphokinase
MILIALGANLPTEAHGPPAAGLEAALALLAEEGIRVLARSRWWRSAPVPPSDQPWFVNGVALVETALSPEALLERLLGLERRFGRIRGERNAPRTLDLDLLDYDGLVLERGGPEGLVLPHPRVHARAFVLLPLAELAPAWRHPVSGASAAELLAALPPSQAVRPLDEAPRG